MSGWWIYSPFAAPLPIDGSDSTIPITIPIPHDNNAPVVCGAVAVNPMGSTEMGQSYIPVSAFISAGTLIRKGQPVASCVRRALIASDQDSEFKGDMAAAMTLLQTCTTKVHSSLPFRGPWTGRPLQQVGVKHHQEHGQAI